MLLVPHERRVANDRINIGQGRPELIRRGEGKEVVSQEMGVKALGLPRVAWPAANDSS